MGVKLLEQRISLVTLGTHDIGRATKFYEDMGWQQVETPDGIVVFDLLGQSLGLYPAEQLARDMGVDPGSLGTGLATYALNTRTKEEVAELTDAARAAGAKVLKDPHDVFWGGHIAYFSDPDGHIWEIAFNPFSPLSDQGAFRWNGH